MFSPVLACTVRKCQRSLERRARTLVCASGHSYDVARSGYINLLQPQDRRSLAAGDTKDAVDARARLIAAGVGRAVLDAYVGLAAGLPLPADSVVVDLGSGSGDVLALLSGRRPIMGVGIDLSVLAADHAARRFPNLTWVVANADRRLPLTDRSANLILSLHARRHPAECARVLAAGGWLLVGVPAQDDLIELRALIQGQGLARERADAVVAEHAALFELRARHTVRVHETLGRDPLLDLLRATYRGGRSSAVGRIDALTSLSVTMATDVLLFAPRTVPR